MTEQKLAEYWASDEYSESVLQLWVEKEREEWELVAEELDGSLTISVDGRGVGTMIVTFKVEEAVLETLRFAQDMADMIDEEYLDLPGSMEESGVKAPIIILEFLKRNGDLIYSREYTVTR